MTFDGRPTGATFAELIRTVWPTDTAKHAARCSGQSVRTAESWARGASSPLADTALRMAFRDEGFRAAFLAAIQG
jgi:hypothetical protein